MLRWNRSGGCMVIQPSVCLRSFLLRCISDCTVAARTVFLFSLVLQARGTKRERERGADLSIYRRRRCLTSRSPLLACITANGHNNICSDDSEKEHDERTNNPFAALTVIARHGYSPSVYASCSHRSRRWGLRSNETV